MKVKDLKNRIVGENNDSDVVIILDKSDIEKINNMKSSEEKKYNPQDNATSWLDRMEIAIEECDVSHLTLFSSIVYARAEEAYQKELITKREKYALQESAADKVTSFLKNCKCTKVY